MAVTLADGNVLIALAADFHIHHRQAQEWLRSHEGRFATCPITQGTLLRFLLRNGMETGRAAAVLGRMVSLPEHVFWPDEIGYDASVLRSVVGHRQVTDSYLVALARHFGGSLVTFDRALAALHPATARLIPA